jgi:hypothetical protein
MHCAHRSALWVYSRCRTGRVHLNVCCLLGPAWSNHSMQLEQKDTLEAVSRTLHKGVFFFCVLWKPDLHYLVHNNPRLYEINSAHTLTCYFFKAYFNIIFQPTCRYYKLSLLLGGFLNQILQHVLSFPCLLHVPAQFNNRTKCCADPRGRASVAYPCCRPIAGIACSNAAGSMDVCPVWFLCVVQASATSRSLGQGSPTVCICVSLCVTKYNNNPVHLTWDRYKRFDWRNEYILWWMQTVKLSCCNFYKGLSLISSILGPNSFSSTLISKFNCSLL